MDVNSEGRLLRNLNDPYEIDDKVKIIILIKVLEINKLLLMRKLFLVIITLFLFLGCKFSNNGVQSLEGYIVYFISTDITFVETKRKPDSNYIQNFETKNFSNAFSFKPNCEIEKILSKITSDQLFDENPDLKGHATFLKTPHIFPAKMLIVDTSDYEDELKEPAYKFKMIYKGNRVEFLYKDYKGAVLDLQRLSN